MRMRHSSDTVADGADARDHKRGVESKIENPKVSRTDPSSACATRDFDQNAPEKLRRRRPLY